jgi:hypothetical protein
VGNYARQPRMATRMLAPVPEAAVQFVRRRAMGDRRFSSSTPGRDPVVDRSWLPLEPGQAATQEQFADLSGLHKNYIAPAREGHATSDCRNILALAQASTGEAWRVDRSSGLKLVPCYFLTLVCLSLQHRESFQRVLDLVSLCVMVAVVFKIVQPS